MKLYNKLRKIFDDTMAENLKLNVYNKLEQYLKLKQYGNQIIDILNSDLVNFDYKVNSFKQIVQKLIK